MKCGHCGAKNDMKAKFCSECGTDMAAKPGTQPLTAISELYGKEVEVLFFIEKFTGKVSGIVGPTGGAVCRGCPQTQSAPAVFLQTANDPPAADGTHRSPWPGAG